LIIAKFKVFQLCLIVLVASQSIARGQDQDYDQLLAALQNIARGQDQIQTYSSGVVYSEESQRWCAGYLIDGSFGANTSLFAVTAAHCLDQKKVTAQKVLEPIRLLPLPESNNPYALAATSEQLRFCLGGIKSDHGCVSGAPLQFEPGFVSGGHGIQNGLASDFVILKVANWDEVDPNWSDRLKNLEFSSIVRPIAENQKLILSDFFFIVPIRSEDGSIWFKEIPCEFLGESKVSSATNTESETVYRSKCRTVPGQSGSRAFAYSSEGHIVKVGILAGSPSEEPGISIIIPDFRIEEIFGRFSRFPSKGQKELDESLSGAFGRTDALGYVFENLQAQLDEHQNRFLGSVDSSTTVELSDAWQDFFLAWSPRYYRASRIVDKILMDSVDYCAVIAANGNYDQEKNPAVRACFSFGIELEAWGSQYQGPDTRETFAWQKRLRQIREGISLSSSKPIQEKLNHCKSGLEEHVHLLKMTVKTIDAVHHALEKEENETPVNVDPKSSDNGAGA
jgi:hypothetical protein